MLGVGCLHSRSDSTVLFYFLVSLENVLLDVKELQRGLDLTKREYTMHDHNTMLKEFIQNNEGKLKKLQDDAKIAQVFLNSWGLNDLEKQSTLCAYMECFLLTLSYCAGRFE